MRLRAWVAGILGAGVALSLAQADPYLMELSRTFRHRPMQTDALLRYAYTPEPPVSPAAALDRSFAISLLTSVPHLINYRTTGPSLGDLMHDFADSEDAELRTWVARVIGDNRLAEGLDILQRYYHDADPTVRRMAVVATAQLGPLARGAMGEMERMAFDAHEPVKMRELALVALGRNLAPEALGPVRRAMAELPLTPDAECLLHSAVMAAVRLDQAGLLPSLQGLRQRLLKSDLPLQELRWRLLVATVDAASARLGDADALDRLVGLMPQVRDVRNAQGVPVLYLSLAGRLAVARQERAREALYQAWREAPKESWRMVFGYYLKCYIGAKDRERYADYWRWWCQNATLSVPVEAVPEVLDMEEPIFLTY